MPIIAAGIGLGGSLFSGITGGKGAKKAAQKAADAQIKSAQMGIDEQRRQFDVTHADMSPWLTAGQAALGQQGDIVGLNGGDKMAAALAALKDSPYFKSLYNTGTESILQNASATGGLRGGNVQRGLADFGADTFAKTIQQQLENLGGISSAGFSAGADLGQFGANKATALSNLFGQQGAAQAGSTLAQSGINQQLTNNIFKSLGNFAGAGGFGGFGGFSPSTIAGLRPDALNLMNSNPSIF